MHKDTRHAPRRTSRPNRSTQRALRAILDSIARDHMIGGTR